MNEISTTIAIEEQHVRYRGHRMTLRLLGHGRVTCSLKRTLEDFTFITDVFPCSQDRLVSFKVFMNIFCSEMQSFIIQDKVIL